MKLTQWNVALCGLVLMASVAMSCKDTSTIGQNVAAPPEWSGSMQVSLLADKVVPVGTVSVSIEGKTLKVTYQMSDGWSLASTHLDIRDDWTQIPQTKTHNPIPGQFLYKGDHSAGTSTATYEAPITWDPGVRLYVAAQADVRSGAGVSSGAWGEGTRFTPRGNWGTYFVFTPTVQGVVEEGDNWQLRRVAGVSGDGTNQAFDDSVYLVQSQGGIAAVPLPEVIRENLQEIDEADQVLVISQKITNGIVASIAAGALTPEIAAIAEPADSALAGGTGPLSGCSDRYVNFDRSISRSPKVEPQTWELGENVDASLTFSADISLQATAGIQLAIRRFRLFRWCIPFAARFVDVHASASASLGTEAVVEGEIQYSDAFQKRFKPVDLFYIPFMAGPIPVWLGFDLPLSIGLDLSARLAATGRYTANQAASYSLSYVCTTSGCTGSRTYQLPTPVFTVGLSGSVEISPWADVGLRGYLYTAEFASAKIGFRPYLRGDLWGYLGNDCGDADADGSPDGVRALTFDLDFEPTVNREFIFFGKDSFGQLWTGGRRHLLFRDLTTSTAMSPMFAGAASTGVATPTTYSLSMRRCWPYSDAVSYRMEWGDGSVSQGSGSPTAATELTHAWTGPGTYAANAVSVSDAHGRSLGRATARAIEVRAPSGGVPGAGLHLWLRGDAGVVADGAGRVSTWQDQSTNGHHASMSALTRQPQLVSNALHGKPVLRFFGTQSLSFASPVSPTQFSVFVVGLNRKASFASMILGPGGSSPNNQLRWESSTEVLFVGTDNNLPVITSNIGDTRVYHALSAVYDGATMTVFRDGGARSTHAFATTGPWTFASIGSYYSSEFLEGDLAEIIVYDRPLSTAERDQVQTYLRDKYGLP